MHASEETHSTSTGSLDSNSKLHGAKVMLTSHYKAPRRLLVTDFVILNHGQVTRSTPELSPLLRLPHHTNGRTFNPRQIFCAAAPLYGGSSVTLKS
ncbi:hypothetical protein TNCV_3936301 [Trichonephila clavipes]|nr:hypothetical protein TNCV_3936301 [Trichonephila clavipes]